MWVMTFHSACARMLRADAHRLGYTRQFTIYDQADSRRLVKRCIDELDIDPKRFTPAAVQSQISDAKNRLRSADDYRQLVGSYFEQTVADVYELYERELHRANAMDFDDLLVRAVNVLELFQEVRDRYQRRVPPCARRRVPGHQPRPVPLAAAADGEGTGDDPGGPQNLAVVGDDDQCLVEGTPVTMADGPVKPIEDVRSAMRCSPATGSGSSRAKVDAFSRSADRPGPHPYARRSRDRQHAGTHPLRRLPVGLTPPIHMTYL